MSESQKPSTPEPVSPHEWREFSRDVLASLGENRQANNLIIEKEATILERVGNHGDQIRSILAKIDPLVVDVAILKAESLSRTKQKDTLMSAMWIGIVTAVISVGAMLANLWKQSK